MPGTAFLLIYKLLRPVGLSEFLLLASASTVPTSLWSGRMHEQINKWRKFGSWSGGGFQWVSCNSDQVKWRQSQVWPLSESFFPGPWNFWLSPVILASLPSLCQCIWLNPQPKTQLNCGLPCPLFYSPLSPPTSLDGPQGSVPRPHFSIEPAGPLLP